MQVSYKRDLSNNYLILKATEQIDIDSYQVRLLTGNHVEGLLSCMTQIVDNQTLFYYEITAKQSFANIYEHQKIRREDLQVLFDCLIKKIEEMRSFLLDADGILLNPEYIFFNAGRKNLSFCYFPVAQKEITASLQELAEYLLPKIDHTDQAAVILGYNIYRCIMEDGVSIEQIKKEIYQDNDTQKQPESSELWDDEVVEEPSEEFIKSLLKESEEAVNPAVATIIVAITGVLLFIYFYFINNTEFSWHIYVMAAVALLVIAGVSAGLYLFKMKKSEKGKTKKSKEKHEHFEIQVDREAKEQQNYLEKKVDSEEKTSMNGEDTMILTSPEVSRMPCLAGVYPPMLQPILVKKDIFVLGKLEKVVDAVLPSFAASRIHARITKEGEYYISDLNSLNGTYVNHKILSGDEKHMLSDGDEIAFGDLIYCFRKDGII